MTEEHLDRFAKLDGMSITINWLDEHMLELRVRASNGRFSAEIDCYDNHDVSSRLADELRGFPRSPSDHREALVGSLLPDRASCRLTLCCTDSLGAVSLHVAIVSDRHDERVESATFDVAVEAGALDEFVSALDGMKLDAGSEARLRRRLD